MRRIPFRNLPFMNRGLKLNHLAARTPVSSPIDDGEAPAPAMMNHIGTQYSSDGGFVFSHGQLGDLLYLAAVLVGAGEKIKGVLHGANIFLLEDLRESGPHPFDVLNRGLDLLAQFPKFRKGGKRGRSSPGGSPAFILFRSPWASRTRLLFASRSMASKP